MWALSCQRSTTCSLAVGAEFLGGAAHGVFTDRVGALTNDFFVNLLDMGTHWQATSADESHFEGRDRASGELRWTGTRADLVFGSNSQLRAWAEVSTRASRRRFSTSR